MIDPTRILAAAGSLTLSSCPEGYQPWLMATLARAGRGTAVFVATDDAAARSLAEAVPFFAPEVEVLVFPAWDCLPYDRASPSLRSTAERLSTLDALTRPAKGARLLVTTVNAVTQRTLRPDRIAGLSLRLAPGEQVDRDKLASVLSANGYARVDTVADAGEFAVRGGLVDLYPAGRDHALRLDFFGDEIESVRRFDPATQRTISQDEGLTILPVNEVLLTEASIRNFRQGYLERFGATATGDPLYGAVSEQRRMAGMEHWLPLFEPALGTLFDYLGDAPVIVRDSGAEQAARQRFEAIEDYHQNRRAAMQTQKGNYRPLSPDALYLTSDEWAAAVTHKRTHITSPFETPEGAAQRLDLGVKPPRDFAPERAAGDNVYEAVAKHVAALRKAKQPVVLVSYSGGARERLKGLLADAGVKKLAEADSWQEALGRAADGTVTLTVVPLEHGFTSGEAAVLTEQDMLGDRLVRRRRTRKADAFLAELQMLTLGDLVVHQDHGIGRYEGLVSIAIGQAAHDCVQVMYDGESKLFVPVENIEVLSRYGGESEGVALDRLGGQAWAHRKAKMKERIREIAHELMKIAAERATREAEVAVPDPQDYAAFVDRFPYAETDDQQRAVDDVMGDLASGRPMDRLVCGDVGFGKTEVALRAAYAAAASGGQVAVVCPTTLLARQHMQHFEDRFSNTGLKVGQLSRLVPAAEQRRNKEALADGSLDIVVGTHAILSKGIAFKRLGLVVVDEEQRFGVTAKERLKALKADVHVLTLTATPIPRTLQMAMSGLRELSIIATPPVDRLAVRTYVMPWDEVVLREALLREHYRGGQSFFVTPRIADLPEIETFLRESVPEISYVVAHGQMAAADVEERMTAFYERKYDVLVATTIIEAGLDIPTANTLIVHRADMFGLAQLYQLRGRVGRAKTRAYAYLTTDADGTMTESAQKRLQVLSSLDSLGAGFQLASHDLDIRGAGNLVGDEQSGHIKEVGFELYQDMLEQAIAVARAEGSGQKPPADPSSPQLTVDAPILIPEEYVPDLNLRMALYRRLGDLPDRPAIDQFAAEMIDRFGPLPDEVKNLLVVVEAKIEAKVSHIAKLEAGPKGALISFGPDGFPNPQGLIDWITRVGPVAKLRPDSKLFVSRDWGGEDARLQGALQLARTLSKLARGGTVKPAPKPSIKPPPPAPKTAAQPAKPQGHVFRVKPKSSWR